MTVPKGTTARRLRGLAVSSLAMPALVFGGLEAWHTRADRGYQGIAPVCRAVVSKRMVALSVDDGPSPEFTAGLVSLLNRVGGHATFFLVGSRAAAYPDLVRMELASGMEVGNHTWSHPSLPTLSLAAQRSQLERATNELDALGVPPSQRTLFRPPYGLIQPDGLRAASQQGLKTVLWSISLEHYTGGMGLSPGTAEAAIAARVRPGDILLAHDGGGDRTKTMQTLQILLPALRAAGFELVTVGKLLASGAPSSARPRKWFWQGGFECPS
jgi:peptidoglycan/xylan/chitin deacetylase (PgdA/CDA1 family)